MTTWKSFPVLLFLLAVLAPARAAEQPRVLEIDLPGTLVAGASTTAGGSRLWLLTRTGEESSLHFFEPGDTPRLVLHAAAPPPEVRLLASADLDGDGFSEAILLAPGSWWSVGAGGELGLLHQGEGRWVDGPSRGLFWPSLSTPPAISNVGELTIVERDDAGLRAVRRADLPVRAQSRRWGLRLSSPKMIPHPAGGWVGWEDPQGAEIPVTRVLETGEAVVLRLVLPEPERLGSVRAITLDGVPCLFASTYVSAGPMANQRIRLFPLPESPGAVQPVLTEELDTHVWHTIEAFALDLDEDGSDEIVLAAPEGMGGGKLLLGAYFGTPSSGFRTAPKETTIPLNETGWHYGDDLDGDGRPDLLLMRGATLTLYSAPLPGNALPRGRSADLSSLIEAGEAGETEIRVTLGSESSVEKTDRPGAIRRQVLDVDGDGASEVLFWRVGPDERTRLLLVSFRR